MIVLKLAKAGYGAGDIEKVKRMRVDNVMMIFQYEIFLQEYEAEFMRLNSKENS